jgi:outer membrane protein assembly factor BamE (lipoprotein component of BamABCDE complex)
MLKFIFAVLAPALFFFCACQTTSLLQDFKRVRLGMDKDNIIETVGNPEREERRDSRDWWYYSSFENQTKYERMVVFQDGKVIYAGRVTTPSYVIDADKVDKHNELINKAVEAEAERARVDAVPMLNTPPPPPPQPSAEPLPEPNPDK